MGPLSELLDGLRGQLCEELDLPKEARVMQYFRCFLERSRLPLIVVPEPLLELSDRRVLVVEFLDGVPVDDRARAEELGYDPAPLVEQVVQSWSMTALRGGVFHGDVHARQHHVAARLASRCHRLGADAELSPNDRGMILLDSSSLTSNATAACTCLTSAC